MPSGKTLNEVVVPDFRTAVWWIGRDLRKEQDFQLIALDLNSTGRFVDFAESCSANSRIAGSELQVFQHDFG